MAHSAHALHCRFACYRLATRARGIVLLYGPRRACERIAATLDAGDVVERQWFASFELAETRAVAAAHALQRIVGAHGANIQTLTARDWEIEFRRR